MIAGLVPWNGNIFKKKRRITDLDILLRQGWNYVNIAKFLNWQGRQWQLLFKVVDPNPRPLPGYRLPGNDFHYIEFKAIDTIDKHAVLYAYGNFQKSPTKIYVMENRQVVRL